MAPEDSSNSVISLVNYIDVQPDSVVSKTLIKKKAGTVTLFAFDQGQGLSEHTAPFDAFVQLLQGSAEITIGTTAYQLNDGDALILPANVPHALTAPQPFKMLLTMIKSE